MQSREGVTLYHVIVIVRVKASLSPGLAGSPASSNVPEKAC